jgi:transcriptional antiterminator RfaH
MSVEWFILQFKPNSYYQAKKNLDRQGFETFLPLYETTSRKASRFINTTRPLFPGYMFVKFDRTKLEWHKINNTYGVSRLVTFNSILKSIPAEVVNNLIARCDFAGKLLPQKNKLKDGDQVKVLSGPLASFIATVEAYETDQRIWILLNLMNRKTRVQTPLGNLKLLS